MTDAMDTETGPAPRPTRTRGRRGRPSKARGRPNSSDLATARWTIRGVPPPVRDMALRAAEARGMTVGDWVAEAIITVARAADKSEGNRLPAREPPPDLTKMLQGIEDRLRQLEQNQKKVGFFGRLFGRRS